MADPIKTRPNLLAELAKAKALFQQRSILAHLVEMPSGSKADQEAEIRRGLPCPVCNEDHETEKEIVT